jgi:hypothetical protein
VSVVADDGDTAGEPVGDVVGIGVGGGGSATALRHTTLIRTSASSLAVISHDGIDASSRNGAAALAFRSSPREGSVSPRRPARTGICRAGIPPAGIRMVWRDNLCVVRSINLVFTDETELVPPIPRFAIGQ